MLPSPATSTPFSVKDILKLEQQRLGGPLEPPFPAAALASCLLGCRFSDGEDNEEDEEKLPFLPPMPSKGQGDAALSPGSYVQAVLRGTCGKPKALAGEGDPRRDPEAGESLGVKGGRRLRHPCLVRLPQDQDPGVAPSEPCPFLARTAGLHSSRESRA